MVHGVFPAGDLQPALNGLFSVADVTNHSATETNWSNTSFDFDTIACPSTLILTDFCTDKANGEIASSTAMPGEYWPFGVIAGYECPTIGVPPEKRRSNAIKQTELGTQKAVERELWAGQIAQAAGRLEVPFLNNSDISTELIHSPQKPVVAIAYLEQGLADCGLGVNGVIHLTRQAAVIAAAAGALKLDEQGVLTTILGTPVAAGTGYDPSITPHSPVEEDVPDSGPVAIHASPHWAFATGPVFVHLGPVEYINEHLDIPNNMLTTLAGRPAAVYWDGCCVVAVPMVVDGT